MPILRLQTLGPFSASLDNQPIYNFKTNKVQGLLIYLAVERDRNHQRESLMELFWPGMPLESAQVNLRQTVYRLRQSLSGEMSAGNEEGFSIIHSDRNAIQINPDVDICLDIEKFQTLIQKSPEQAVSIYRGDFLADFYLPDSSGYETWSESIRENLRQKALKALEDLTEKNLQLRDFEQAQMNAWKQLEIDKYREVAYRQLMKALVGNGQRNAALSQFQLCKKRLEKDLGVRPSQDTYKLYEEIQNDAMILTAPASIKARSLGKDVMPIFMLTDIEDSTRLWDTFHEAMLPALLKHNQILEDRISQHGGRILELRGDGVKAVFEGQNPLACMIDIQKDLGATDWGAVGSLKIRIGLHGLPTVRKGYDYFEKNQKYYGPVLNHTARIMDAGWGGQILVSEKVRNSCSLPVGARWEDFGKHQLKSLENPFQIYGLLHPDLPEKTFPPLRTLSSQANRKEFEPSHQLNNIPPQATPFIGRSQELEQLEQLIKKPNIRLVTIVGPGGMGKTRLALASAKKYIHLDKVNRTKNIFPDGIFFIPLAPLKSSSQIVPKIINILNVPFQSAQSTEITTAAEGHQKDKLLNYLKNKKMLIILDNFEHILDAANLVPEILNAAPGIKILATSRERLNIFEEQIFPLQGLEYPNTEHPEKPSDFTAMELFLDSARRVRPDFDLKMEDMIYLTRICTLIEGMPLGLELAASWVDMLSIEAISNEIKRSIDFLETEIRNIPERHQSMRAVFDSSWEYLNQNERQIFPKFSVFRGSFSREAAERITGASIRDLSKFVQKSFVQYSPEEDCYHIHELMRQYGEEHLSRDVNTLEQTRSAHSKYYAGFLNKQLTSLMKGDYTSYEKIESNLPNIQEAINLAIERYHLNTIDQAIDGICLFYDWHLRDEDANTFLQSVKDRLSNLKNERIKDNKDADQLNQVLRISVKVLTWEGYFCFYHDHQKAYEKINKALSDVNTLISSGVEAKFEKTLTLFFLGLANFFREKLNAANSNFVESLKISREIQNEFMVLRNLYALGDTAKKLGIPSEAKAWYEKSLEEAKRLGNRWGEITALVGLGWVSRSLLDFDQTKQIFEKSLDLSISYNNPVEQIRALESLGYLTLYLGQFSKALEYFSQAVTVSSNLGIQNRAYSSQVHLGMTKWLQGKFSEADSYIATSLNAIHKSYPGRMEFFVRVMYAEYLTMAGRYSDAKKQMDAAGISCNLFQLDRFVAGRSTRTQGWIALSEKNHDQAVQLFRTSIELYKVDTDDEQVAWSQAGLALAMIRLGDLKEAKQLLTEALWTSIEIKAIIPLLFTIPGVILYLSETNPALAGEVFEQIQISPFLNKTRYFKDCVFDSLPEKMQLKKVYKLTSESQINNQLWSTASMILSKWIQVFMNDPTTSLSPSVKEN